MRVLLDECVDERLRHHFKDHDCQTARYAGLAGIRGVTPQAIENLMKKGRFHTLSIGGRVLLDRRDVENYKPKRTGRPRKTKKGG